MKTQNIFINMLMIIFLLYGCTDPNRLESIINNSKKKSKIMQVNINISLAKSSDYFKNSSLVLKLYEFDPRLADVSAKLINSKTYTVSHTKEDKEFIKSILLFKDQVFKENKKYYIVVRLYDKDGKQTHHGYKDGTEGFIKILEDTKKLIVILK